MRETPPAPDTKNDPSAAGKHRTEAVIPTRCNRKGDSMFLPQFTSARLRHQGPRDIGATVLLTVAIFALPALAGLLTGGAA